MSTPTNDTSRRVSFADEVLSRRYNIDDTVFFESGSVPDIYEEVEPLYDSEAMNTPRRSPFSNRRSRIDIWGSPSRPTIQHNNSATPAVVAESLFDIYLSPSRPPPKSPLASSVQNRVRSSPLSVRSAFASQSPFNNKRAFAEDDEDDGSDGLMAYLKKPVKHRNIFDEDDEDTPMDSPVIDHAYDDIGFDRASSALSGDHEGVDTVGTVPTQTAHVDNTNIDPDKVVHNHDHSDINSSAKNIYKTNSASKQSNADIDSGATIPIIITADDSQVLHTPVAEFDEAPNRLATAMGEYEEEEEVDMIITDTYNPAPVAAANTQSPVAARTIYTGVSPSGFASPIVTPIAARNIIQSPSTTFSPNRTFFLKEAEKTEYSMSVEETSRSKNRLTVSEFLAFAGAIGLEKEKPVVQVEVHETRDITKATATDAERVIASEIVIPQYDLYRLASQKLIDLSDDCKENIRDIRDHINNHNPKLFQEYIDGTHPRRSEIEVLLKKAEKISKLQAAKSWYDWWAPKLEEVYQNAETVKNNYQKDYSVLQKNLQTVQAEISALISQADQLKALVADIRQREQIKAADREALANLELETEQQNNVINATRSQTEVLQQTLDGMKAQRAALEKQNIECDQTIKAFEETIARDNVISEDQMIATTNRYTAALQIYKTRVNTVKENTINFLLSGEVDVTIDKEKLDAKNPEAVLIRMSETVEKELGPFAELVHGLSSAVVGIWQVEEITQKMAIYWNRLKFIMQEVKDLSRRYFTTADPVPGIGVSCKVVIFHPSTVKFEFSFDIKPDTVMSYPRLDTYNVKYLYAKRNEKELKELIENCILEKGLSELYLQMQFAAKRMSEEGLSTDE